MYTISHAATSHIGRKRKTNEDAWFARPELGVFGVSDGMGGQAAGQLASRIVAQTLPCLLKRHLKGIYNVSQPQASDRACDALRELNTRVSDAAESRANLLGMGATVVVAIVRSRQALICHMGDSRAYLMRNGVLQQLTRDHSLSQLLIEAGELTPSKAATHPGHVQLTRFVGMQGEPLPEDDGCLELQAGDRLLLCSDGLTSMVDDHHIREVLQNQPDPATACSALLTSANDAGGKDNITALIIQAEAQLPSID